MTETEATAWLDAGERKYPLVGRTFSLGRARENNLVFTSAKVSRRHALVHAQGASEFSLVDLGSSNGTHLNGRRVIQPVNLQHGDVIQIGEESLVFRHEAPVDAEEPIYSTAPLRTVRDVREMTCWFLLLDIESFVRLSAELASNELGRTIGSWIAECQRVIEKSGGAVSKFLGDGLLAHWNARFTESGQIVEMLSAFRAIQARREPPFRLALHFGNAVFGAAPAAGEVTTLGQDLNFLFRIERIAAAERFPAVISAEARARLDSLGEIVPLGEFPLKGFDGVHPLFGWR